MKGADELQRGTQVAFPGIDHLRLTAPGGRDRVANGGAPQWTAAQLHGHSPQLVPLGDAALKHGLSSKINTTYQQRRPNPGCPGDVWRTSRTPGSQVATRGKS